MKHNLWWGYVHTDGGIHVKRFFDEKDIDEARQSGFVLTIYGPFEAADGVYAHYEIVKRVENVERLLQHPITEEPKP